MSLRGASFLSLSFPLSFSFFFLSACLPHSLVPTCSLKSCLQWYSDSPRTNSRYAGSNGLSVSLCLYVCVCVCVYARKRVVDVESLKLFFPCPNKLEFRPFAFNLTMLHSGVKSSQAGIKHSLGCGHT